MRKRPTVVDVANRAQVGASTVSRYLRGVTVSPPVAHRIQQAIDRLGYQPDEMARALRTGRAKSVGLVLPKVSTDFFSRCAQQFERVAAERGYTLLLLIHQEDMEEQHRQFMTLRRLRVDGAIIVPVAGTIWSEASRALGDIPVVFFDSPASGDVDAVVLDNHTAARVATEHLIKHKYRQIACVYAKPQVYTYERRAAGYLDAIKAHRRSPYLIAGSDYTDLQNLLFASFQGQRAPDAILSLSDSVTLLMLTVLDQLGVEQVERPAFISFDDFRFALHLTKSLTAVRQPVEDMADAAARLLFHKIEGKGIRRAQTVQLQAELVVRASCGCRP